MKWFLLPVFLVIAIALAGCTTTSPLNVEPTKVAPTNSIPTPTPLPTPAPPAPFTRPTPVHTTPAVPPNNTPVLPVAVPSPIIQPHTTSAPNYVATGNASQICHTYCDNGGINSFCNACRAKGIIK